MIEPLNAVASASKSNLAKLPSTNLPANKLMPCILKISLSPFKDILFSRFKSLSTKEVVTPSASTPVRRLSGGNVQKILVGREIAAAPKVFMAAYPVRGLDINAAYSIYNLLNEQKEAGVAVIFVGEDLDVLIDLCDRIMVIASGQITGTVDARNTTKEEIGLLMTKTNEKGGSANEEEKSSFCKRRKKRAALSHNKENQREL